MDDETFKWCEELLAEAMAGTRLSAWERGFLQDQLDRIDQYGKDTKMSPKQVAILDRVATKIGHPNSPSFTNEDLEY